MVRIKATVISQKGHCAAGHKVGDETVFDWDTNEIEGKMCLHMMYSVLPKVFAFAHGAKVAWATAEDGEKVSRHACPDGTNPVIVELRRLD
ncbi:TIGR04076 family protein [Candidatus Bathyarchaeota archaeon]|nr:TIGR04076 family protein [Candidatus Bathyarchaeota archaeon]